MAAAPGLLFWLLLVGPPWRVPGQPEQDSTRRFSQLKLCADDECSMLMYRGEALEDFTGPDCRFVNFKKGDTVYVYYKLAGGSPEVWAGTVGRTFGYFPKNLIQVVHEYTQEELQVPTDETDFVCFDGGRDDFDNYNVEELLGFLELYDSATGDSEEVKEETIQHVEEPPEASNESDPEPEPEEPNSEENESVFSENTAELRERSEAQKSHPQVNSQTGHAQGERTSFESLGEMLQDKLKVPESENKTSNSSQVSHEQEKIDAYKLLKTEMTLDLKTKFGSTADALVSDDETTRLVTSLEDDFVEDLDPEYYTVGKEEEESKEDFDELPLLTFTDGEDTKTPGHSGVEKHPPEKEQSSNEEHKAEETQPLGIKKGDKKIPKPWGDTIFSDVMEGKENTDTDLESSNSKEEDDPLVMDSRLGKPRPEDHIDPEKAADSLVNVEVPKADNDNDPAVGTELNIKGKGRKVEEPKRDLVQHEVRLEDETREDQTVHSSPQSGHLSSSPAAEKSAETLKSAFANQENDVKGAPVHISKEMLHEEKTAGRSLEGASESDSVLQAKAAGNQGDEGKTERESVGVAAPLGDHQRNASKDSMEEVDGSVRGPKSHMLSGEHPSAELIKDRLLKLQNQTRFSSPDDIGLPGDLEEEDPVLERNLSWEQGDVAATVNKQVSEKRKLSEEEVMRVSKDASDGGQEAGKTGQTDSAEGRGFHPKEPNTEDEDYSPEELLEDENAISAKQSKENSPEIQEKRLDVDLQVPEKPISGAIKTDPETEENKEETSPVSENERKNETASKGVDSLGRDPGGPVVEKEGSSPVHQKAQRPSEGSDFPGKKEDQTPELGEASQKKDPDYLKEDNHEGHPKTSGLVGKPGVEPSKEDEKDVETFVDPGSQGSASEDRDDDPFPWAPHAPMQPEERVHLEDLPIISSFFKDQQSLQRFQKYFDIHKLEAMFQDMSSKLKSAQGESLPYNVEKVLDKVFRAWESHILTEAENMLDARVKENRDLETKDSTIFEEAVVLDDVQDLIYFIRYKHSMVEETAPLAAAQPVEGGWDGPAEDAQPPLEENFPQEDTEGPWMQIPKELGHLDLPMTRDMGTSGVAQKPKTEEDGDPALGIITPEGTPVDAVDVQKQLATNTEEPASVTPLENAVVFIYSLVFHLTKTERPAQTNAIVDDSAPPSVAQLAGRFREQAAAAKETPANKPTRRKPPCSLSLFPPKVELGQNGEEKSLPSANHPPKVKVKSSPLIEKLQANLAFDPAALLPGASPKSPGFKAMVSPFHSPPSTPSSPGVRSRPSEPEEVPVSFDQPPEGSHLPCYNKVRTRGSIKRRPPSRRFRRSQSDCGELGEFGAVESSQENGAKEENEDEVFPAKSRAPGSPPLRRMSSRTEKLEEKSRAVGEAQEPEKIRGGSEEGAGQYPARASSSEAEDGCGSPTEEKPAGEQTEEPTEVKERVASEEEEPGQSSQDTKGLEEGAVEEETPPLPPGGREGGHSPEQGTSQEKQDEGAILEPGCHPDSGHAQPDTSSEVPRTEDNTPVQDTKM